ncbi:MAG: tRNA pseudouridine(55) synthase TruB [Streptococcaceae bacterium]|jgi:tRNA pseudouridine55 synthase|nr:tRNA pseudouridine(55) synthase TruB [Streptococcaceae bacterium]
MDGILNVFKEADWTSNDVVQKLRGILKTKKVGHAGTLDPAVTGVLPVAVGKATRLLEYMDTAGKVYKGEVTLGFSTETEDAEGEVVERKELAAPPTEEEADQAILSFVGKIQQTPPMYSAVKINGKKLYEYARAGQVVERPSREVEIKKFVRTSDIEFEAGLAKFSFEVACSKGTYIRTLAVDLATKLGYLGHMSGLQRTMANGLKIEAAKTLKEIEEARDQGQLEELFQPLFFAVEGLPKVELTESQFADIRVGKKIEFENIAEIDANIAVFYRGALVGIVLQRENQLKPKKILI